MVRLAIALGALIAASAAGAAERPIEVMVLGSYHFGNPGLDTNNIKVDSVLTPPKQAELEAVAKALMAFRPTKVMVEMQSVAPDLAASAYTNFTPADLKTAANETDQLGFRIARMAGLDVVNAIDEQPGEGEPDYYPYDKLQSAAKTFGQTAIIEGANAPLKRWLSQFEADQKTSSVAELLIRVNSDPLYAAMDSYYAFLPIGDFDNQAGADLNAAWYLRNAKIFGKLMHLAQPGDRVLVVYGAGHGYWLRHFANTVPGYRSIDPIPYLKRARKPR
jgi:Family of unknown function (DUF5694)